MKSFFILISRNGAPPHVLVNHSISLIIVFNISLIFYHFELESALIAFKSFRKLFLLFLFPLFLWFHSFQLTVPDEIDEATLFRDHTFHAIREIDCRLVLLAKHWREIPNVTNNRPRRHHHIQILHH